MLGNHVTNIRLVLAFNQSLHNVGDLSEFTLEQVLPSTNYFTRLSFEQFPSFKDRFFKNTKYLSVMDWADLQSKKLEQIRGLSLQFISQRSNDAMLSGFAGGGKITCLQQHFDADIASYVYKANLAREVASLRPEAERKVEIVWDDAFMIAHFPKTLAFGKPLSIEEASIKLNTTLRAIEDYALNDDHKKSWASHFVNARNALNEHNDKMPVNGIFADVSKHLSPNAQKLLLASSKAWVFGGMGSWNDGFGEGNYQKVTDALFNVLHECYVSVCGHSFDMANSR